MKEKALIDFAKYLMSVCLHQESKKRPLSNIDIKALVEEFKKHQ